MKDAALEIEKVKLAEVLSPPDPSAWSGFLITWKRVFKEIGEVMLNDIFLVSCNFESI